MRPLALHVAKELRRHVGRGHPWIYASALKLPPRLPARGAIVDVVDREGFLARGWFDPDGPIAVRVLARAPVEVDGAFVAGRVAAACALRRIAAARIDSDAVRLLHGEADGVPGLVLDRYVDTGVVRFDGAAAEAFWAPFAPDVARACAAAGVPLARIWARAQRRKGGEGTSLLGDPPPPTVTIREGAARFEVDVVHGQKTGFFLDQRENRAFVGGLAAGGEVANLFGYTGGFSVAAALGGARRVVTVDLSRPAIDAARRNFDRSGVDPAAHEFHAEDVFDFVARARAAGRRFDVVICDPPSFAPSEKSKPAALAAYRDVNAGAAALVAPGGLLATASCSSHVSEADLSEAVGAACASLGRRARILAARGAAADHPIDPAFPEGRYLKFLLVGL